MAHCLVELERKALECKNAGRLAEAAELFSKIVVDQPEWERGMAFYNLAQCYEDLGRLELAEKSFRTALTYQPSYTIFLGGFASFLYLHGKPEDAFDAYVELLKTERDKSFEADIAVTMVGLNALGERLGWSRDVIAEKIAAKCS